MRLKITTLIITFFAITTVWSQTVYFSTNSENKKSQRVPVLEHFTTEACSNCPPAMAELIDYYNSEQNYYILCHHAGFMEDFLTTPKQEQMLEFFYNGASYVPAGMVDRHYNGLDNDNDGFEDLSPIFKDSNGYGIERVKGRLKYAPVEIDLSGYFDLATNKLNLDVTGILNIDLQHELGLIVWILEDNIPAQYQAGVPDYIHRFASRDALTHVFGDKIENFYEVGNTFKISFSYDVNPEWNRDELYILAMVGNMHPTDINDREVQNSIRVKIMSMSSEIADTQPSHFDVYTNPNNNEITLSNVENAKIEIFNISGQSVKRFYSSNHLQRIDGNIFNAGVHIIKVIKQEKSLIRKIVIN